MDSERPKEGAAAIILTGGKSSRMGRPKAMLGFAGEPLISHIVRKLGLLFSQIIVVAAPGQEIPPMEINLVRDEVPHQGPVGGIYYGMRASDCPICFVTSCDAPFLNVPLISHLLLEISSYDVVVPIWGERLQPLHAIYHSSVLPFLQAQLERKELRPIFLYDKVRTRKVPEQEIRRFDPEGLSFLNMNTPDDYERALQRWGELNGNQVACDRVECTVEFFGVAQLLTRNKTVSLALPQEATLSHLFSALAERMPVLVGRVITPEKNRLVSGCACNVNGLEFVRNPTAKIRNGDKILILSADAGG